MAQDNPTPEVDDGVPLAEPGADADAGSEDTGPAGTGDIQARADAGTPIGWCALCVADAGRARAVPAPVIHAGVTQLQVRQGQGPSAAPAPVCLEHASDKRVSRPPAP